jgi:NH3-dependent NAD+ synthetase
LGGTTLTQFLGFVGALNSKIVNKAFSPDIIPGIVAEDAIRVPYEKLDLLLLALEKGWDNNTIMTALFNPLTTDRQRHIIPPRMTG